MSRKLLILLCLGVAAFASAPLHAHVSEDQRIDAVAPSPEQTKVGTDQDAVNREIGLFRNARVSLQQAMKIAERIRPGATTADISFDGSTGEPLYKVRTVLGGRLWEYDIDAQTAAIRRNDVFASLPELNDADRGNVTALNRNRLKMSDAVVIAERSTSGKAVSGGLTRKAGKLTFIIVVLLDDGLKEVTLEPAP